MNIVIKIELLKTELKKIIKIKIKNKIYFNDRY